MSDSRANWATRLTAAGTALAVGLSAASATPSSLGGAGGPLMATVLVTALVLATGTRAWLAPVWWVAVAAASAGLGFMPVAVAVRVALCGAAGSVLWFAFESPRALLWQGVLAAVGATMLVADGAVGPRLGPYEASGISLGLGTLVRLTAVGFAVWVAFRRRESDEDEGLGHIALFLQGSLSEPSLAAAAAELEDVARAARGIRERVSLERDQASAARIRIHEVALKVRRESDLYQSGAAEQVGTLSETSTANDELLASAREVQDFVRGVADVAEASLRSAQGGMQTAQAFAETIGSLGQACRWVAEQLELLKLAVQRIAAALDALFRATSKADVLALSAELEAANAEGGEARFFSVASQMRQMGEVVARSMGEIAPLLEEIRQAVRATSRATDLGVSATSRGFALSSSMAERLGTIAELAGVTAASVKEVASMTEAQIDRTAELDQALQRLSDATRTRTSAAPPMVATGRALEQIASAAGRAGPEA